MQGTDHLMGQIVFATATDNGVTLDCLLGAPGAPGLPVSLRVRRAGQEVGRVVTGQLAGWAAEGTTVEIDLVDVAVGQRVRLAAGGTVVVLEPDIGSN
jgi:hypothetical protein